MQGARKVARGEAGKAGRQEHAEPGHGEDFWALSYDRPSTACSKILQVRTTAYPGGNGTSNPDTRKNSSFI